MLHSKTPGLCKIKKVFWQDIHKNLVSHDSLWITKHGSVFTDIYLSQKTLFTYNI